MHNNNPEVNLAQRGNNKFVTGTTAHMFRKKTKEKPHCPKLVHEFITTPPPPTKTAVLAILFSFSFPS